MAYFPFFIDISGKTCAVIGGGTVALRKIEKLLPFGCSVTVTAPEICREIRTLPVTLHEHRFLPDDLDGADFVIAATNAPALNSEIFALCSQRGILCNAVDDKENCSFLFPALVHLDDITVGISTGGTSPAFAKYLRQRITSLLDERTLQTAVLMKACRPVIRAQDLTEDERREAADALLHLCLSSEQLPDETAILQLLEAVKAHEYPHWNTGQSACLSTDSTCAAGDPSGMSGDPDGDCHSAHKG